MSVKERRLSLDLNFELVLEDNEEADFLLSGDQCDVNMAIWDYLHNWVVGDNKYKPERPGWRVEYHNLEVTELDG